MARMCVLLYLMAASALTFGQTDSLTNDIRTTLKFRPGVYFTYSQFRTNSPAISSGFKIRVDTGSFVRYLLIDGKGKRIRDAYGFCDGERMFINAIVYGANYYFVPVLMVGDIVYFEDNIAKGKVVVNSAIGGTIGFGLVGGMASYLTNKNMISNPGWLVFLDDDDGYAYALSRQTMKSILKESDPDLYKLFQNEKDNNDYDVLIRYLIDYNRKRQNKH